MSGGSDPQPLLDAGVTVHKFAFDFPIVNTGAALTIGRPFEQLSVFDVGIGTPAQAALAYFNAYTLPLIIAHPNLKAIESPNEKVFDWLADMRWYSEFLYEFSRLVKQMGRVPVIGNWAVGTPDNLRAWEKYGKALQATKDFGAILSRHSYGVLSQWYALRHRLDQIEFRKLGYDPKVVITECGLDNIRDPNDESANTTPWRTYYGGDSRRYFEEWIKPFELELRKDSYIVGATLFTMGAGGNPATWGDFDIANTDIVNRMAELSRQLGPINAPPAAPPPQVNMFPEVEFIFPIKIKSKHPGRMIKFYDQPQGKVIKELPVTWVMDAWEVRGAGWFRVSPLPGKSGTALWLNFLP